MAQLLSNWRERGWVWILAALAAAGCLATSIVFSPGYISADAMFQLEQAMGRRPMSDWHPPVMSLLWRVLIEVTGTQATMAILQVVILWASLFVIAWCVWDLTRNRAGSLAVLAVGLAPHVLTFVGVVWKDVQMAFAFLAASAVAIVAMRFRPRRPAARWALFGLGVLFLVYAILVRKNAIFAAIPVFVMLVLALWPRPGRKTWLFASATLVVGLVVPSVAISSVAHPIHTSQVSQVMLDDLLHVLNVDELRSADVSPALREHLVSAAKKCQRMNSLSNAYWTCYGGGAKGPYTAVAHTDEIKSLWVSEMPGHLSGYLQYRLQVFSRLMFNNKYEYAGRVVRNDLGLQIAHPRLEDSLRTYVLAAVKDVPWLFTGGLWLVVGLVMSFRPGKGVFSMPIRAMGVSSVVYVLGYLPILPVGIYRYVYWPAIAGSLGLLLLWVGRGTRQVATPESDALPESVPVDRDKPEPRSEATVATDGGSRIG